MSALTDTQSERDDHQLPIDRVGVRSLRFPLRIRDRDSAVQHTVATVSLAVDLPHQYKGTHMSRFVEVLEVVSSSSLSSSRRSNESATMDSNGKYCSRTVTNYSDRCV